MATNDGEKSNQFFLNRNFIDKISYPSQNIQPTSFPYKQMVCITCQKYFKTSIRTETNQTTNSLVGHDEGAELGDDDNDEDGIF